MIYFSLQEANELIQRIKPGVERIIQLRDEIELLDNTQIEFDNKLVFAVEPRSTKRDIKRAVEELFKVKVIKINVQNSFQGQKRAYVKLAPNFLASDVSADLGLI